MLDVETCHAAVEARDRRFDGRFYTGVASTGIYCRCICSARTPKRANRNFFASAAAAEAEGYRPCLICRPERAPGFAPADASARLAARAMSRIEAGALDGESLASLAQELGVVERHLRRVVRNAYGASPVALAQTARLLTAKRLLADTSLSITDIAFASGFQSLRRFNAALKARYGFAPSALRGKTAGPISSMTAGALTLSLTARGDYNAAPIIDFLARRAIADVEEASSGSYARTLRIGANVGWIRVSPSPSGLACTISETLAPSLRALITSVRAAFDLDADCAAIDAHLARDARFAALVAEEPGVRIAGCLDGFEIAVRAVLGQQITLGAALRLVRALCVKFGEHMSGAPDRLSRLFPTSQRLATAGVEAIAALGMPRGRAEALHALATAHASGELGLTPGADAAARTQLAAIKGIGPWTIDYIALRALADPDAYPATDAALVAALGAKGETLQRLSPWRGYAAMRLWRCRAAQTNQGK